MMIRFLLSIVLAACIAFSVALLSACGNEPSKSESLAAQPAAPLSTGFATLADSTSPADLAAAPVYSRLALYRARAAGYLRNGLIPIGKAKAAQSIADTLRANLDRALASKNLTSIKNISELLDEQINALEKS